ncbi:PAP fibrillin [Fragilaria crotonensis]|nr:PAP fibrillin [Fragilaria crotonensis]
MRLIHFVISIHLLVCHGAVVVGAFLYPGQHGTSSSQRFRVSMMSSGACALDRDVKVQQVLTFARKIGPIGSLASEEDQQKLVTMSQELVEYSDPNPSQIPLHGVHYLVYSASEGASSGRLGPTPLHGKVKQEFRDDNVTFINSVSFGPLEASLRATRSIKNDSTNLVKFHQTTIKVFGQTVVDKEIKGGGFGSTCL